MSFAKQNLSTLKTCNNDYRCKLTTRGNCDSFDSAFGSSAWYLVPCFMERVHKNFTNASQINMLIH